MPVLMALDDAEYALLGDQPRAIGAGYRLAVLGRHLVRALLLGAPRAQGSDLMGHLPDASWSTTST